MCTSLLFRTALFSPSTTLLPLESIVNNKQQEYYLYLCIILVKMEVDQPKTVNKYGTVIVNNKRVKADVCLRSQLGPYVDLRWNIETAELEVMKSEADHYQHEKTDKYEVFRYVPFFHDKICQLEDQNFTKNPDSKVVPCAVVLIRNGETKKILATQRHERMSFGSLWVLPGGHLEPGETIIEGGIRQCEEEVGLQKQMYKLSEDPHVMLWESVLLNQTNDKVKRVALIVFFSVESQHFEVKQQKSEVKAWQWRQFEKGEHPWGGGWAEGHLKYLDYLSSLKTVHKN